MKRLLPTFIIVILATTGAAGSQQTATTFEVASIKKNETGRGLAVVTLQPSGRVSAGNMTVRELMLTAYGLEDIQLIGTPAWAASDRFEIEARTNGETSSEGVRQMLRALLAERFALEVHHETRELPVLALVQARADGKTGERLRKSGDTCAPISPPPGVPTPPPPPPGLPGGIRLILPRDADLRRGCGTMAIPGWFAARRVTMSQVTRTLTIFARRPVIDRTGLDGEYDLDLNFTPEFDAVGPPPPGGAATGIVAPAPPGRGDAPSLFTALQEQLGLKLDAQRAAVSVLVLDRVEKPTEN
jgi:uncharacterized protein (TIGR03435 family)